ncbi:hypothetical protein AB4Y45_21225 [Paraburkholderia sp. EG287A]|uniref:hypothetical protein n=1 Tax=Paraburkholderia sp. EG287A TaxID=3237012 RepID=UPI0034D36D05
MAFLERVEHYINKSPMWTPAEGALLVNGVMPPPKGCADIPGDAAQLEDPVRPATQSQLLGARSLLDRYHRDVDNGAASQAERITSDEFLEWCKDGDFFPTWTLKLPEFLRHLYFPGDAHNQYPQSVEDELAMLRMVMAAKEMQRALVSHTRAVEPSAVEATPQRALASIDSDTMAPSVSSLLDETTGLKTRERQIRTILARIHELKWIPMAIKDGGKSALRLWCKKNHPDLFGDGDDPFNDAWKVARSRNLVSMANQARFAAGRK